MRIKAFFLPVLVICLFVFALSRNSVFAAPSNNPVFATIEQVQQMISNATFHQKEFRVYDNNNQELGIFIEGYGPYPLFYIESQNKVTTPDRLVVNEGDLRFVSANCTGTPLNEHIPSDWLGDIIRLNNQFYLVDKTDTVVATTTNSYIDSATGHCISGTEGIATGNMYAVTPITLPYGNPISLPVHIRYQ
jgi:hypothetical protein